MNTQMIKFEVMNRQPVYDIVGTGELQWIGESCSIISNCKQESDAVECFSGLLFLIGIERGRIVFAKNIQTGTYSISITVADILPNKWIFDKNELLNIKNVSEQEQKECYEKAVDAEEKT